MSGAAALASARRRRAAPQGPVNPGISSNPPPVPSHSSSPTNDLNSKSNTRPLPKQTPAQMLLSHNTMISNLQEVVSTLNDIVDQNVIKRDEMKAFVESLIREEIERTKMSESNIQFFKEKYNKVEGQLNEIKKHVLKIQSFAMDTNLQCIELKKRINRDKNYETIDDLKRNEPDSLEISNESRKEHLSMLKQNTALNRVLDSENE